MTRKIALILLATCAPALSDEAAFKTFWEGEFAQYKQQFDAKKAAWDLEDTKLRRAAAIGDHAGVEAAFSKMKQIRIDGEAIRVANWSAEELAEKQARALYKKGLHEILEAGTPAYLDWVWLIFFISQTGVDDGSGHDVASLSASMILEVLPMQLQAGVAVAGAPLCLGLSGGAAAVMHLETAQAEHDAIIEKWNRAFRGADVDTQTLRSAENLESLHADLQIAIENHKMYTPAYVGKAKAIAEMQYIDGFVQEMQEYWDFVRAGDANEDGQVTQADADQMVWGPHNHIGKTAWALGDFNQDGTVDFLDFLILSDAMGA